MSKTRPPYAPESLGCERPGSGVVWVPPGIRPERAHLRCFECAISFQSARDRCSVEGRGGCPA
jgi:hypothetical protein